MPVTAGQFQHDSHINTLSERTNNHKIMEVLHSEAFQLVPSQSWSLEGTSPILQGCVSRTCIYAMFRYEDESCA